MIAVFKAVELVWIWGTSLEAQSDRTDHSVSCRSLFISPELSCQGMIGDAEQWRTDAAVP